MPTSLRWKRTEAGREKDEAGREKVVGIAAACGDSVTLSNLGWIGGGASQGRKAGDGRTLCGRA